MSLPPSYGETLNSDIRSSGTGVELHDVLDESYISCKGIYEVQGESAPLAAALALEKPKIFSKQMRRLYFVCAIAYLSMNPIIW